MTTQGFGPYHSDDAKTLAKHLGIPADIMRSDVAARDPEAFQKRLLEGRPQILLHRSSPRYGHYFLIHRLPSGAIEVFDSQATGGETLDELLMGDQDNGYNGPAGWLGDAVSKAARSQNLRVEYNRQPSQSRVSESCLLHVLSRALVPEVSAGAFVKKADRFFDKYHAALQKEESRHAR